jgi:hypothetical protein
MMNLMFRDYIGRFMHVYLDDIFVFSDTIEDHSKHIALIAGKLHEYSFYLKPEKCELFATSIKCLGHKIDDLGIHCDEDKLSRICSWHTPRNYNDVQKFLGLVQYFAQFFPNLAVDTGPLSSMTKSGLPFDWCPIHSTCFDNIKALASKTVILKPIDFNSSEHVWVICDASVSGVGAMYGQGPTWQQCKPAGFMSKKFTSAQQNYRLFELETLAILEALIKWEDKLVGCHIHIVTDHKALEFFLTQHCLSHRQAHWMKYLSRFNFDICYVKGEYNQVADAFSRYYETDTWADVHHPSEYVHADAHLDPEFDDVPNDRIEEIQTGMLDKRFHDHIQQELALIYEEEFRVLQEIIEPQEYEAEEMR